MRIENLLDRFGFGPGDTLGLAFSGGGAKGFSHIGVLMAFERFGLRPDIMSGVSSGAIASVLYGAGLSPFDIINCFSDASKFGNFVDFGIPKKGIMKLESFGRLLEQWLPVKNLEELKIPTIICATDFDHGKSVGWGKGEIIPRLLASCSIPVIFNPIKIHGVNYVDGGVLRNLPAWAIRRYCKTLFGSNCSPLRESHSTEKSIMEIAYRSFHLMMKANVAQDIRLCDRIIQIHEVATVSTFDLSALKKGVNAGYEAASKVLENIYK